MVRIVGLAFVVALSGAMTPGPFLTLVIAQVLAGGFAAAVFILIGHALLETVFVIALVLGLVRFLDNPRCRGALGLVGGGVLLWMGGTLIVHAPGGVSAAGTDTAMGWLGLIAAGVGASLSNPYFTGWWATVGACQIATLEVRNPRHVVAFYLGHECGDCAWYLLVAGLLVLARRWITPPVYQALLIGCAVALIVLGGLFVTLGVRFLRTPRRDPPATAAA